MRVLLKYELMTISCQKILPQSYQNQVEQAMRQVHQTNWWTNISWFLSFQVFLVEFQKIPKKVVARKEVLELVHLFRFTFVR